MDPLKYVVQYYQVLMQEWTKKPPNLEECGNVLQKLKVALTQVTFLPTSDKSATKKELLLARDILELGAQWSIKNKNIPAFERYMAQLKCYYLDYQNDLPESASKYQLLGLNLLCLLAQNRVAEFHTFKMQEEFSSCPVGSIHNIEYHKLIYCREELELLPAKEIQTNVYIRHPVSMEQYLMEGSYNKVFLSGGNVPAESYNFFINILLDTVRNEIAACIEKAYEKLALNEASRMLFFTNKKDMTDYAEKRGWNLSGEYYMYDGENKEHSDDTIPAFELATQVIDYARELEMIV